MSFNCFEVTPEAIKAFDEYCLVHVPASMGDFLAGWNMAKQSLSSPVCLFCNGNKKIPIHNDETDKEDMVDCPECFVPCSDCHGSEVNKK
jgi:hypothetical protein